MTPDLTKPISKLVRLTQHERFKTADLLRVMKRAYRGKLTLQYARLYIFNRLA